jgi:TolA-binding protein
VGRRAEWNTAKGSRALPFAAFLLLGGVTLLAPGCADMAADGLQQDVAQLRQDVNSLMLSAHRGRGDTETVLSQVERRSRAQSAEANRQLTALASRLDGLASELGRLSARLDEVSQRIERLSRQMPTGEGTPQRPATVPAPAPQAAAPAPVPHPSSPAPPGPAAAGTSGEAGFQSAYLDFTRGHYPLALSGFRDFLRRAPDSPQADSAQYWIGEAYFSMARASAAQGRTEEARRGLEQAVQEFRKLIVTYPRGGKVPTALYKEALALVELKQTALAQARLQYLLDHFPQSEEAPLAKERLAALKP